MLDQLYNYDILSATTTEKLRDELGRYWQDGWRPIGGVCIGRGKFYQAVVLTRQQVTIDHDIMVQPKNNDTADKVRQKIELHMEKMMQG